MSHLHIACLYLFCGLLEGKLKIMTKTKFLLKLITFIVIKLNKVLKTFQCIGNMCYTLKMSSSFETYISR